MCGRSYRVDAGPNWSTNPVTYTCQEACAIVYGGTATSYACSTASTSITHTANTSIYAVSGCAVVADTYKKGANYNCGTPGCGQSAYVTDNCVSTSNYCFK